LFAGVATEEEKEAANKQAAKKTSSDALLFPVSLFWSSSLFSSLMSGVKVLRFHPWLVAIVVVVVVVFVAILSIL
jgi:hypothetical protein